EQKCKPELKELSDSIYHHPELGFEEFHACKVHTELLKKYGFEVETNICGLETAFRGIYKAKKPGPVICYMAEYDALPEIGHGCGHNMLGTSSTGAAIVLKHLVDETGGTVLILGTPAEETSGAKVNMAEEGIFADVDVALMAHPETVYKSSGTSLALQPIQFEFFGKTAHAASHPHKGINALDAAILTFNNINALREHIVSTARVHGVIKEGGTAANIVPEYSRCEFYVRATNKKYLLELTEKVKNCAKAGALATGCTMKHSAYELAYDDLVTNERLNQVFKESIRAYTDDPIEEGTGGGGSIDAGNVSHVVPTIHGYFPIADHPIPGHTREFAEATLTDYAYNKLDEIICILALTGYRVLTEPEVLKEIKEEFEEGLKSGKIIPPRKK
ncbi:MAG: M20 family metallopeptidase, partial [Tissierellia bacterium]|nr:M20 family metallopeptidase [Tissierellia bacterium]